MSPRMPMSLTNRNSMVAPSEVLKMNSTNYEKLARNSQSIGFNNVSITTGLESNNKSTRIGQNIPVSNDITLMNSTFNGPFKNDVISKSIEITLPNQSSDIGDHSMNIQS
jgi:hypothetical protein